MASLARITIVLTIFLFLLDAPDAASLNKDKGEIPGLYKLTDNIEIFTKDNIDNKLYNKPYAILLEFYSSWCGHCQNFAPFWREFAHDVVGWTDIVKIGAIDCGMEDNTPTCRKFDILGYPTVLYFHEQYQPDPENKYIRMKTSRSVEFLHQQLNTILHDEQKIDRFKQAPQLLAYEGNDISGLFNKYEKYPFLFVIVESFNSTMGSEVILDFHYVNDIAIRRVTANNSVVTLLNVSQLPSLVTVFKDLTVIPITPRFKNRTSFVHAIRTFSETKEIQIPQLPPPIFNADFEKTENDISSDLIERVKKMGDVVFQVDLENALHYSLKHEVSGLKQIDGDRYKALIQFLNVLIKYFPFQSNNGVEFLTDLKQNILSHENKISGEIVDKLITQLEQKHQPVYSLPLQWVGCRGSDIKHRGYPCGLWKLFHFLTVRSNEQKSDNKNEVLVTMHGYITNFFGCEHCREHFQQMAVDRHLFDVNDSKDAVMWLWEAHNVVNKRLANDVSEDPEFPKIQFPNADNCPACRNDEDVNNIRWNRDEVFKYLKRVYSVQNIYKTIPSSQVANNTTNVVSRAPGRRFISSFD